MNVRLQVAEYASWQVRTLDSYPPQSAFSCLTKEWRKRQQRRREEPSQFRRRLIIQWNMTTAESSVVAVRTWRDENYENTSSIKTEGGLWLQARSLAVISTIWRQILPWWELSAAGNNPNKWSNNSAAYLSARRTQVQFSSCYILFFPESFVMQINL